MARVQFDHIAIAVARMADVPAFLVGELGGVPFHGSPSSAYIFGQWRYEGGGVLEILEPLGADGFLHRFLAQHGPGVHHVTFRVPGLLRDACARAEAEGYRIVGYDDSNPAWQEAFLHPKQALGIVVQIVASAPQPASAAREPRPRWQHPPGPQGPPPPVTVLGLRMLAQSRERALRQWARVLGGEASEAGKGLVFRWPGSPMRIVVEIDSSQEEGPIAIELASRRPLALAAEPHPVLGVVFSLE